MMLTNDIIFTKLDKVTTYCSILPMWKLRLREIQHILEGT